MIILLSQRHMVVRKAKIRTFTDGLCIKTVAPAAAGKFSYQTAFDVSLKVKDNVVISGSQFRLDS